MTEAERLQRAGRAAVELPVVDSLAAQMREELIATWIATKPSDTASLEKAHMAVHVLDKLMKALRAAAQDGAVVRHGREMADLLAPERR